MKNAKLNFFVQIPCALLNRMIWVIDFTVNPHLPAEWDSSVFDRVVVDLDYYLQTHTGWKWPTEEGERCTMLLVPVKRNPQKKEDILHSNLDSILTRKGFQKPKPSSVLLGLSLPEVYDGLMTELAAHRLEKIRLTSFSTVHNPSVRPGDTFIITELSYPGEYTLWFSRPNPVDSRIVHYGKVSRGYLAVLAPEEGFPELNRLLHRSKPGNEE